MYIKLFLTILWKTQLTLRILLKSQQYFRFGSNLGSKVREEGIGKLGRC